jgi:transposase
MLTNIQKYYIFVYHLITIFYNKVMNKSKTGRPVDLSGINTYEIDKWMHSEAMVRKVVICQSIMALHKGVPMVEVCRVLGVTREGVRLWKEKFRTKGLEGVLREGKVGKRSRLTPEKVKEFKQILKKPPKLHGMEGRKWTGIKVKDLASQKWGMTISLRTAQAWLSKNK